MTLNKSIIAESELAIYDTSMCFTRNPFDIRTYLEPLNV